MAQDTNKSNNLDFDSENIFEEFTQSEEIQNEVQEFEQKNEKDLFYYLKKLNSFLFSINIVIFLWITVSALYIFVQTSETKKEYNFLTPICDIFLGNNNIAQNTCYGVTPILNEYEGFLDTEKEKQAEKVLDLLGEIYAIENFNLSRKVSFLLERTNSRVRPLEIIEAFDDLKKTFSPIEKKEISCYDLAVHEWNILELSCDAYSPDWDTKIIDLNDGGIALVQGGGTSISRASSFIHFIDNYENTSFQVLEKPEKLSAQEIQSGPYTQKTTIQLRLQYQAADDLSF